jgi:arylsulfatase A-like enzyme
MKKVLVGLGILIGILVLVNVYFSFRSYNVILITIDTLRPDYLSCYSPDAEPTPNIDAIAKRGVRFTNAYTLIPITFPSHVSILTSRQPYKLNVFNNGDHFDHNKAPLVSDFFANRGYQTAAFISLGVLKGEYGLSQGFHTYEDDFGSTTLNGRYYKVASEVNELALPWLEKVRKKHFFAWIHYSDPHEPYVTVDAPPDTEVTINGVPFKKVCLAKKEKELLSFMLQPGANTIAFHALTSGPEKVQEADSLRFINKDIFFSPPDGIDTVLGDEWKPIKLTTGIDAWVFHRDAVMKLINHSSTPHPVSVRFAGGIWNQRTEELRDNYAHEVQFVDKNIGQLWDKLKELKVADRTIIIVTSDHGEGLKTHGILGHVDRLWNETIHVPLILYYPGMGYRGKVVDSLVNLLDIMPTILSFAHVRNKSPMEGQSLKYYATWSPIDRLFAKPVDRYRTFASTFSPEARVSSYAVTDLKDKVIHTPNREKWQWEAYELDDDPLEKKNLVKFDPKAFDALVSLKGLLEAHVHEAEDAHSQRGNRTLTDEQKQMLKALGYADHGQNQTQTLPEDEDN